jgi:hypothetical protein
MSYGLPPRQSPRTQEAEAQLRAELDKRDSRLADDIASGEESNEKAGGILVESLTITGGIC